MDIPDVWLAVLLTVGAGLSTGFGGLIVMFVRKINGKVLSASLGFSAGVMIYISFVELFVESNTLLTASLGAKRGPLIAAVSFFAGMLLITLIDKVIPSYENPHESRDIPSVDYCDLKGNGKLLRTGILTALIIAIHNFPEGMATFVSSVQKPSIGIAVAIAIAIHNIPEGISVAIPVYCSTGDKKKALWWSLISGIGEPLGALIAYLILLPVLNDVIFGVLFGVIAGIMVFISFDELLPSAEQYGEHHISIYGLISGMIVMSVGLLLV